MVEVRGAIYCLAKAGKTPLQIQEILDVQFFRLEAYANANRIKVIRYYQDIDTDNSDTQYSGFHALLKGWELGEFEIVLITNRKLIPVSLLGSDRKFPTIRSIEL